MALDLNFSGVDSPKFGPKIAEGETGFTITKVEDTRTKAGDRMIKFTLSVTESSDPASVGEEYVHNSVPSEKGMPYLKAFLEAVLKVEIQGPLSEYVSEWDDLVGSEVNGQVFHKPGNTPGSVFAAVNLWF